MEDNSIYRHTKHLDVFNQLDFIIMRTRNTIYFLTWDFNILMVLRHIVFRFIANWKRAHGANNILQAFGFCDYAEPDAAIRAIRLGFLGGQMCLMYQKNTMITLLYKSSHNVFNVN